MNRYQHSNEATVADGILLFGMPRSGTTWVGKIFDSHPVTVYRHEPDSWRRLDDVPILPPVKTHEQLIESVRSYYYAVPAIRAAKVCGKTPIFRKSYLNFAQQQVLSAGVAVARVAGKLRLELPVVGVPGAWPTDARLVWKSIESIGRLRLFVRALPSIKAVHLIRHPCGYISSVLRGESSGRFEDNRGASEDYGILGMLLDSELAKTRGLTLEFFRELDAVERLAWRWALFNDEACRASAESARCITVRYEEICTDPVEQVKGLFKYVGLDWSLQTEAFLGASTANDSSSYYSVYKDPNVAANKWRNELDEKIIERVRSVVASTTPGQCYADDW